ncbi:RNA polymerase sigma factor [Pedobacter endophyticus]|uniref:Sigma-70 family RNA polymerase sigma factor n=1 Tax=Pedobacter endophyticus TaxID=2789740 RepID=A0A7S9KZJ2_9SPHI|nr:sigma-70 family RNA polymerase sigma factor [Pedobacter endophyticus]QPH39719.1 sigma-70 family RNA polymerase sigma factor [Pedobacter endophyticus]
MAVKPLLNESELLAKIAGGDERAFKKLFDGYCNPLGAYIFKLTGSMFLSQEIVQDVFIKVWMKKESLLGIKSFKNYIFILCRNQTYNEMRNKAKQRSLFGEITEFENNTANADPGDALLAEYRELLDAAIDNLPAKAQQVYLLSRDERMKHEEIARMLNISAETVKKHIQYATRFITDQVKSKINSAILSVLLSFLDSL